jgi:mono/diheme cytochrome c family protein
MNPLRIFFVVGSMIVAFGLVSSFITSRLVPDEIPPEIAAVEMINPRAPSEARQIKNPVPDSEAVIAAGKQFYLGKGNCYVCHGKEGRGDGEGGAMLNPPPRDLTDPTFQRLRTDGELFWSIKEGVPQTGMFSYAPRMISEEAAWKIIRYIRTIKKAD